MRTLLALALLLGIITLFTSCLSSRPFGDSKSSSAQSTSLGSFTVSSQILGNHVFTPKSCFAGDRQFFLGADLKSQDSNLVVRLVVDPLDGPAVKVFSTDAQFDRSILFHRSDCRVFHFSLDSTGWRVNDTNDYRITLQLDCSRQDESIKGSASSTHCN